ncbi:hypothetical protein VIBR0546_13257 [Vibrio brasiliensis LMG 20546]|uniref:Uncharacterized protein n=1 Tax=Vibrio brasiliensis LMG 20546 TaxID=945543 RepID=E8LPE6_9VIBR|nr:hypothetical protein VIBR0546_13257 [Vibrio brasiliensis LMG 20546]
MYNLISAYLIIKKLQERDLKGLLVEGQLIHKLINLISAFMLGVFAVFKFCFKVSYV